MAQRILGLDLGASAVKAVLLESTYRGFVVLEHVRAEVPAGGDGAPPLLERQAAVVGNLVAARGWRPDETVAAFPGAAVSSHVVTLPFTDPRRIEQTVGFEVEGQIPFDLEDVAWDWQPLGTRDGKTDLLVGVVRKEELAALLAALSSAGLDPRAVVPAGPVSAALAATGALAPLPPSADGAPATAEAIVDVGAERTSICVVAGGACEAARTFGFGAGHLARAVARELGVTEAEAALLLAAEPGGEGLPESLAGLAGDPRAAEALRRALPPLVRELRATLRAWRARVGARAVARLALAGEAARLPGLPELLAPEVDGPVAPLARAGPAAEVIDPAAAPGFALALGLALRGHQGSRAPRLNLRRGALAFTRDFEHLKGKVARLGVYAALVLLLAIASAGVKVFALSRQEALLDRSLCDAQQKILGKCYPNFEEAQAILRGRGTPGASLPRVSAVEVFTELAERVPPDVKVRFDRIEVTRDKLHLEGATEAAENVDKIVSALRQSRCFGDARSGSARKRASDGKFEFSVDSGLTCLESGPRDAAGGRG
jgi:general secretion pathway protein L